ncbi:MAG: CUB domain-containing protein [Bacteroidota bacterium]
MRKLLVLCSVLLLSLASLAQVGDEFSAFFQEAYESYPNIPEGVLEAVAYTQTRMQHIRPDEVSCQGLPTYYSVMGLVEDGKGYFQNSLQRVAALSSFTAEQIKADPRISILAYAESYQNILAQKRSNQIVARSVSTHEPVIAELTEIPDDGSVLNEYAKDQQFYAILKEMEKPHTGDRFRVSRTFEYQEIFGEENFQLLSAPSVKVDINTSAQPSFSPQREEAPNCTEEKNQTDYATAIWAPANTSNFGSRRGANIEYVTIHTIQGSYASAISWFKNSLSRVSTHYVIRSFDGQVTQMVCEEDMAFHVKADNNKSIGIEHEGFIDDGKIWYTQAMYESSANLVKDICERNRINPLLAFSGPSTMGLRVLSNACYKIKGHQHFRENNHIDPGPDWDWDRYYRLLNDTPTPKVYTARKGDIVDDGGKSGNYPSSQYVSYLIQPSRASSIQLNFEKLDLEGTDENPFDYLLIYDGQGPSGRFLGRYTGNKLPPPLVANSGNMYLEFHSDCRSAKAGFQLSYTSKRKDPECAPPENLIAEKVFPFGAVLTWSRVLNATAYLIYIKHKNNDQQWTAYKTTNAFLTVNGLAASGLYEYQIQSICGTDTSGLVGSSFLTRSVSRTGAPQTYAVKLNRGFFRDSGGENSSYLPNERWAYTIQSTNGEKIELNFQEFNTEANHDILTVYDGKTLNAAVIGRFSGTQIPAILRSSSDAITLAFQSDGRTESKGWKASWKTVKGTAPIPDTPDPTPDPGPPSPPITDKPTDPVTPPASDDKEFDVLLPFNRYSPETRAELDIRYTAGSEKISFDDTDKGKQGFANRFYNLAYTSEWGFKSPGEKGFLFDDFNRGLNPAWTEVSGNWAVQSGRLVQSDRKEGNANIHTSVLQDRREVYVYHWRAKMEGDNSNKRHGLHFFASDPEKPDRGNSYFVWIRDASSGDFIEIYKTINDSFSRQTKKAVQIKSGEVYDYKVIFNPVKGKIEVYINNKFSASWTDGNPHRSGKAVSIRSANCELTLDNLIIYHSRGKSTTVSIPENKQSMQIASLVVDRRIRWSPVSYSTALIGAEAPPVDDVVVKPDPTPPSEGEGNARSNQFLKGPYAGTATVTLGGENKFYLPASFNGGMWTANRNAGFLLDEFPGGFPNKPWRLERGLWTVKEGKLLQNDFREDNGNIYIALEQKNTSAYLYHWKAQILNDGNNIRFGIHIFADDPLNANRGNSYLIWFRNHDDQNDKVEVYRASKEHLLLKDASFINLQPGEEYDCKVIYDPSTGSIQVFIDALNVLSWKDPDSPLQAGKFFSFRTGNSKVAFSNLGVYQQASSAEVSIPIGSKDTDLWQFKSVGNKPAGRLYLTEKSSRNTILPVIMEEAVVK